MQNTLRERQKAEATELLKLMGAREDVRQMFEGGTLMLCEGGRYRPLSEGEKAEAHQFELEYDATVYLAVRMDSMFGTLDALLFVGKYDEEWEMQREDIKAGYALSYTINRDYPECSEMGSIFFHTTKNGGIVREN